MPPHPPTFSDGASSAFSPSFSSGPWAFVYISPPPPIPFMRTVSDPTSGQVTGTFAFGNSQFAESQMRGTKVSLTALWPITLGLWLVKQSYHTLGPGPLMSVVLRDFSQQELGIGVGLYGKTGARGLGTAFPHDLFLLHFPLSPSHGLPPLTRRPWASNGGGLGASRRYRPVLPPHAKCGAKAAAACRLPGGRGGRTLEGFPRPVGGSRGRESSAR